MQSPNAWEFNVEKAEQECSNIRSKSAQWLSGVLDKCVSRCRLRPSLTVDSRVQFDQ